MALELTLDGTAITSEEGATILQAAQAAGRYIPALCAHPDLPPNCKGSPPPAEAVYFGTSRIAHDSGAAGDDGCGLCVVEVEGQGQVCACATAVRAGMIVRSTGPDLEELRRERMAKILAHHPHACLTCAQREGCTREPCSMNVPVRERCCSLLGRCEIQAVAEHVGIDAATPRYKPPAQGRITDEPLFERDPALCIACGRCVRVCAKREVFALGWVRDNNGRRWVGPLQPTPIEAGCRLCGSCVEVCPTGALLDKAVKPAQREESLVPCKNACPAAVDVPRYVRLIAAGRLREAAAVVAERAPLVEVLGHICFHPCQTACRRNQVNGQPLSICRLKREAGAASAASWTQALPSPVPTGKRVAVVGGGPAGLVAAHLLRLLGHRLTLFEAQAHLGGMLAHGIPSFRLRRSVVEREVAALVGGIEVRTGTLVENVAALRQNSHFDAVLVATGAGKAAPLRVPGTDLEGVRSGVDFLAELAQGDFASESFAGQVVAVVGGGNVAIDCARSAVRLGATRVELVCLEQPAEMPAFAEEVAEAQQEGVCLHHGWGVAALEGNGRLQRLKLKRCTRVFDEAGRFAPAYDEAAQDRVDADAALLAIGQCVDRSLLPDGSLDGVFLAGDLATGPRSVIEAIASAREAALALDRYLGGSRGLELRLGPQEPTSVALGRIDGFAALPRLAAAREEAGRCLNCDLRLNLRPPPRPPPRAARLAFAEASLAQLPESEGVLRYYDGQGELLEIAGAADLRAELASRLGGRSRAASLEFELCAMYTQRQNELLSHYLESHGRMPPGASDEDSLDDLF